MGVVGFGYGVVVGHEGLGGLISGPVSYPGINKNSNTSSKTILPFSQSPQGPQSPPPGTLHIKSPPENV